MALQMNYVNSETGIEVSNAFFIINNFYFDSEKVDISVNVFSSKAKYLAGGKRFDVLPYVVEASNPNYDLIVNGSTETTIKDRIYTYLLTLPYYSTAIVVSDT